MGERRGSGDETALRRSPRLQPISGSPPAELSAATPVGPRLSEEQRSVVVDIPVDYQSRNSQLIYRPSASSVVSRQSSTAVNYPTLDESMVKRTAERRAEVEDFFEPWRVVSPAMRQRKEMFVGTHWRAYLEVKRNKIIETWLFQDPSRSDWYIFAVDGTTGKVDEQRLFRRRDLYLTVRHTITEEFLFPMEMITSVWNYFREIPPYEATKEWGRVCNPLSDVLTADFKCASCGKVRKLRHLHARLLLKSLSPERHRCHTLRVRCSMPITSEAYHPTSRTLEQLVLDGSPSPDLEHPREEEEYHSWQEPESPGRRRDRGSGGVIDELGEEVVIEGNTLAVLKALGKQGMSVKSYDGTGGCMALKVWGKILRRYLRLFNIREGIDQVTVATCFLEGKAKDWWDNVCITEQHQDISNVDLLLHAMQVHFKPLNEDVRLSLLWKTLQQTGDVNAYRQQVYHL